MFSNSVIFWEKFCDFFHIKFSIFFLNFRYSSVNWTNFAIFYGENPQFWGIIKLKKEAYNQCFPFSFVVPEVWRFFQIFSIFFSNLHFFKKKENLQCVLSQVMQLCPKKING